MMAEGADFIARSVKKLDLRQSDMTDRAWDALLEMKWKGEGWKGMNMKRR